jgi:hypothetical protein
VTFAFHSERNGLPPGAGRGLGFSFLLHEPYLRHQLLRHVKEPGERVLPLSGLSSLASAVRTPLDVMM